LTLLELGYWKFVILKPMLEYPRLSIAGMINTGPRPPASGAIDAGAFRTALEEVACDSHRIAASRGIVRP